MKSIACTSTRRVTYSQGRASSHNTQSTPQNEIARVSHTYGKGHRNQSRSSFHDAQPTDMIGSTGSRTHSNSTRHLSAGTLIKNLAILQSGESFSGDVVSLRLQRSFSKWTMSLPPQRPPLPSPQSQGQDQDQCAPRWRPHHSPRSLDNDRLSADSDPHDMRAKIRESLGKDKLINAPAHGGRAFC